MWRLFLFITAISAQKLPSYIHTCSKSEADLNQCFIKNANAALPFLVNGDKKFRLPSLLPLKINKIIINPSPTFEMRLTNVSIYGFENGVIKMADVQLDKNQFTVHLQIPLFELKAQHTTSGKVLVLPIEGSGPVSIKIHGGLYKHIIEIEHYDKNGRDHVKVKKNQVEYDIEKMEYNLENLFNGNKQLSDHMNVFLNENWQEISTEFKPTIQAIMEEITRNILSSVIKNTPYNEIFTP